MTRKYFLTIALIFTIIFLGIGCGKKIDQKITQVNVGMDVIEVIEILGKPNEAWGSSFDADMVFIYKGSKPYSILFNGSMVIDTYEGCLGGPDAIPLNQKIKIIIDGGNIEFQREDDKY